MPNASKMLVVTTNDVPGYEIAEVYGDVFGITVRSRNIFGNIGNSLRTMFGGEATGYTKMLMDSRMEALNRMSEEAAAKGANAVVAMRFDTGDIFQVMNEVAVYGTAVFLRKAE